MLIANTFQKQENYFSRFNQCFCANLCWRNSTWCLETSRDLFKPSVHCFWCLNCWGIYL